MVRAVLAPLVWVLAALLLVLQRTGDAAGAFLDAYDRGTRRLGRAVLRAGRRVLALLGPLGRLVRALTAPLWRGLRAVWAWLNVQVLLRMFRPLRRLGRWVVRHVRPPLVRLVRRLQRLAARLEPVLARLTRGLEAVERAAGRLGAWCGRRWAPVRATVARWRGAPARTQRP